jgi:hypothetical protein
MVNTYQKIANNTCDILQGLTYAVITDSIRKINLQLIVKSVVPLITYNATIQMISEYIIALICLQSYGIDITILDKYDVDITVNQEVIV